MPQIPDEPEEHIDVDSQDNLQGYQDDLDISKGDPVIDEETDNNPYGVSASPAERAQGLRDSAAPDQEGGNLRNNLNNGEPSLASQDDYREELEDRGEDDKERSTDGSWH